VIWHGTGLWATGLPVLAFVVWALLRGRLRARQYRRIAEDLSFTYLGRHVPETLNLSKASFWNSWDLATNVIMGTFKRVETAVFHFHANHGEVGYKQTTVAMKSSAPVVELSSLWQGSGIRAERIGEWIVMFRPKETIAPSQIPSFLDDCRNLLQYFEDHQGLGGWPTRGCVSFMNHPTEAAPTRRGEFSTSGHHAPRPHAPRARENNAGTDGCAVHVCPRISSPHFPRPAMGRAGFVKGSGFTRR
jgi:hypothetical protein